MGLIIYENEICFYRKSHLFKWAWRVLFSWIFFNKYFLDWNWYIKTLKKCINKKKYCFYCLTNICLFNSLCNPRGLFVRRVIVPCFSDRSEIHIRPLNNMFTLCKKIRFKNCNKSVYLCLVLPSHDILLHICTVRPYYNKSRLSKNSIF